MLEFKKEYFQTETNRHLYPTTLDLSKAEVYGCKDREAYMYKIPNNRYTSNAGNIDFSLYPNGVWSDYTGIKIVERLPFFQPSINFNKLGDITPSNLNKLKEEIKKHIVDLETAITESVNFIDSGVPGQNNLPYLPEGCVWFRDPIIKDVIALPISELYGKFNQMIDELRKILLKLLDKDYNDTLLKFLENVKKELERQLSILAGAGSAFKPKQVANIEILKNVNAKVDEVYEVLGYYRFDDGATHKRVIANEDDGSGVQLTNGLWANIVHNGEVNVSWFGAKSNIDEDQSQAIQKTINYFFKCNRIVIDKTYQIDNSISFPPQSMNITIDGYGGRLNYTGTNTALKLEITRSPELRLYPQYIFIKGLYIKGNYKCTGISIKQFNNWKLEDIQIWSCLKGITITDTYYGEISGKSTVRDCLYAVNFVIGTESSEANTINIDNLGIELNKKNKVNFIPKNPNETDEDYNKRVISIGINIESLIFGVKFRGITIEGVDYGFYSTSIIDGSGSNVSIYTIQECYFEDIQSKNIYINNNIPGKVVTRPSVNILNNRFYNTDKPIEIDEGKYNILNNQEVKLILNSSKSGTTTVNTDLEVSNDISKNTGIQRYKLNTIPRNNDSDNFTGKISPLRTLEVRNKIAGLSIAKREEIYPIYSTTASQLCFYNRNSSIILKGDDNNYYSLIYQDGKLRTKLTNNLYLIETPVNVKTAIYAMNKINEYQEGDTIKILELGVELIKTGNVWSLKGHTFSYIGTAEYFATHQGPSGSYHSPVVYNSETGFLYKWFHDHWQLCSINYVTVNSVKGSYRAIGTTAERPNIAGKNIRKCFVYYNTDTKKYEMFKDGQWVEWDKVVRIDTDDYYDDSLPAELSTTYMSEKMKQENVYNDYIAYMDEKALYDKQQEKLEKEKQLAYKEALKENPELTYEEFISLQPMTLNLTSEPEPSQALQKFIEKYL